MIGEGGSGGAVAIALADRVLMQENAIYSVISPEGCAAILWRDAGESAKAAAAFKPDAAHCLELGVIDGIVPEPAGGAHDDHDEAARLLGAALARGARRARRHAPRTSSGAPPGEVPRDGRFRVIDLRFPHLPQAFPPFRIWLETRLIRVEAGKSRPQRPPPVEKLRRASQCQAAWTRSPFQRVKHRRVSTPWRR